MTTRTACLGGIFALMVFFAGTAFGKGTCEEQEAKEAERLATAAERLATAATRCEEKLLDKGCDASACQLPAECVPIPLASPRYVVGGASGTLIDLRTCLVWEKKCDSACGGLHDVDNEYAWACDDGTTGADDGYCQPTQEASDACFAGATIDPPGPDADRTVGCRLCDTTSGPPTCSGTTGETIWEWIVAVNTEGLDGYDDWRIPNNEELESLLTPPCPGSPVPCVDPAIGPTAPGYSWSATTDASRSDWAWFVNFGSGTVGVNFKTYGFHVRAVRGGL